MMVMGAGSILTTIVATRRWEFELSRPFTNSTRGRGCRSYSMEDADEGANFSIWLFREEEEEGSIPLSSTCLSPFMVVSLVSPFSSILS